MQAKEEQQLSDAIIHLERDRVSDEEGGACGWVCVCDGD